MEKPKRKHSNIKARFQTFFEVSKLSVATIVGFLGAVINAVAAIFSKIEDKPLFIVLASLSLVVVIAIYFIKLRNYWLDLKGMYYLDDPEYTSKLIKKIKESTDLVILESDHFDSADYMVAIDDKVNEYLFNNAKNISVVVEGKYELPKEYTDILRFSLDKKLNSGRRFFNATKYRLYSSINVNTTEVKFQKTKYFYSFATNENALKRIRSRRSLAFKFDGGNALFDDEGKLLSNEASYQSNHIGASTLAFTKDGYVIIGKQGNENNINGGRIVPSGSGSITVHDLRKNLEDTAVANMDRELREECGIHESIKVDTKLIAYGRFVNRGFKPDFFGISFIDATKEELSSEKDDGELAHKSFVKVSDLEELKDAIHKHEHECSIQLKAYLYFLEKDYVRSYIISKMPK